MPIITEAHEFHEENLFVDLRPMLHLPLYLKCEGFNFAGSIKLLSARYMVEAAERSGVLTPGRIIVESSSGNLGVALSIIAASKGYEFVCVMDPRGNPGTRRAIEALGGTVHMVEELPREGGYLGARLNHVKLLCASDDRYFWLNQYANPANAHAHYDRTAAAISRQFPDLRVLFVGAGTTGTLMGCARYFKQRRPWVLVVAIDAVGSVAFGGPPAPRFIPGLGTGVRPPLLDLSIVDDVRMVSEADTIRACRQLARRGFLFGGSTGTVVSGASTWLAHHPDAVRNGCAVAIAPDLGERYLETIYRPGWPAETLGMEEELLAAHPV
ncbi:MAG TPA: 2,3-diaminopropionate biosynthesis protein SbnA [Candidatus Limnocylindrales bacterium]|nr:2,3-diaminopropionate biosynthesis protein SbnA [Candidatus Limnocylindrales bacterium]